MAYLAGTTTIAGAGNHHLQLLDTLRRFAAGYGTNTAPVFTGTGNGTCTKVEPLAAAITQTIYVKFTSGTAFNVGTTNGGSELGTGTITASAGATADFAHAKIRFRLTQGATLFVLNDLFTIAVTQGATAAAGNAWIEKRNGLQTTAATYGTNGYTQDGPDIASFPDEVILYNTGLGGTQAIYIGMKATTDGVNSFYYWQLNGATAFNPALGLNTQAGAIPGGGGSPRPIIPLANTAIAYKIVSNAQRIALMANMGTVYEWMYLGLVNTYYTLGQYPLPLFIGGSHNDGIIASYPPRYTDAGNNSPHTACFNPRSTYGYADGPGALRKIDGTWIYPTAQQQGSAGTMLINPATMILPYANRGMDNIRENLDGSYNLKPIQIVDSANIIGEFDGIAAISGYNLVAGSTVTEGANTWQVGQNVYQSAINQFIAMKAA